MGKRRPLQHVTIHGHSVGYRRAGSSNAQTILLIHGLAGSSKTWDAVIDELAVDYDVIAPDLLGHGESAKPLGDYSLGAFASGLRDFLAVLDVRSATVVGHSFGGGVAMQLAYQHPHLTDRLVLVGSGAMSADSLGERIFVRSVSANCGVPTRRWPGQRTVRHSCGLCAV